MSQYLKDLETYKIPKPPITSNPVKRFEPKPDPVLLKLYPDSHPLSSEQQIFFIRITEGAFGFNEHTRNDILGTLAKDFHVKFLAPYLSEFIRNTILVNIAFPDLSLLIYSVRMAKSLIANPHVNIKEHLHVLLPPIVSCVISKKISKYHYDNHWTLRDFSAQIVAGLCNSYSNKINQIKTRIVRIYLRAIQDLRRPMTTVYGGLKGLSCFGEEPVKACIIPLIPALSRRICTILEKHIYVENSNETKQIKHVSDAILTIAGPVLLQCKNVNDGGTLYVKEFGYLGYSLYSYVKNLEKMDMNKKSLYNVFLVCK